MTSDGVCHRSFEVVQSSGLENAASSNQSILQIFFYFFFLLLWKGGSIRAEDCSHMNSDKAEADWEVFLCFSKMDVVSL